MTRTQRIVLATGVTLLALHHPVDTAHRIAMIDHLARGRFYWGIGTRAIPTDLQLYGLDPGNIKELRERSLEAIDVILGLWQAEDGRFSHQGKYYQVEAPDRPPELGRRLHLRPYQQPHPPIGLPASTPDSDGPRFAGERGWMTMSGADLGPVHLRSHWDKMEKGAQGAGRTADRSQWRIVREVYVSTSSKAAREEAREVLGKSFREHQWLNRRDAGGLGRLKLDPSMTDEDVTVDYMIDNFWFVGDPEECAQKIRRLYQDVGGFSTLLTIPYDPDNYSLMQQSLRLLAEEVGPRLRDLE